MKEQLIKMKQSNSFSEMFDEVIQESYVGDNRVSGAPSTWGKRGLGKRSTRSGQNPPFSITTAGGEKGWQHGGYNDMNTQGKDETDAPKIFANEVGPINTLLIDAYKKLKDAANQLQIAANSSNPSLTKTMKDGLKKMADKIDGKSQKEKSILRSIYELGNEIEQIARLSV